MTFLLPRPRRFHAPVVALVLVLAAALSLTSQVSTAAGAQTLSTEAVVSYLSDGASAGTAGMAAASDLSRGVTTWVTTSGQTLYASGGSVDVSGYLKWPSYSSATLPANVATLATGASLPRVAVSSNADTAIVAWLEQSTLTLKSKIATWDNSGISWSSSADTIETQTGNVTLGHLTLAMSGDGSRAVAAWWMQNNSTNLSNLYLANAVIDTATKTASWTTETFVTGTTFANSPDGQALKLIMSADGSKALALWHDQSAGFVTKFFVKDFTSNTSSTTTLVPPTVTVSGKDSKGIFYAFPEISADGTKISVAGTHRIGNVGRSDGQEETPVVYLGTIVGSTVTMGSGVEFATRETDARGVQFVFSENGNNGVAIWQHKTTASVWRTRSAAATTDFTNRTTTWGTVTTFTGDGAQFSGPQVRISDDGTRAVAAISVTYDFYVGTSDLSGNTATWTVSTGKYSSGSPRVSLSSDGSLAAFVWDNNWVRSLGAKLGPADTTAPSITSGSATPSVITGATTVQTYVANETVTWSKSGTNSALFNLSSGGVLTFASPAVAGTYTLNVIATDAASNATSLAVTVTVTPPDSTAPTVSGGTSHNVLPGETAVATYSADESVTWTISGVDASLFDLNASGVLTFKASAAVGSYTVNVIATDASANARSTTVTITVAAAPAPVPVYIPAAPVVTIITAADGSVMIPSKDSDGDPITATVSKTDKNVGVSVVDGKLVVSDKTFSGKLKVDVLIKDDKGGTTTVTVDLVVNPVSPTEVTAGVTTVRLPAKLNALVVPTTVVKWEESPNAVEYRVEVNGSAIGTTEDNSFTLKTLVGPKTDVEVVPLGNDGTVGASIEAEFELASSATIGAVNFSASSWTLSAAAKKQLDRVAALMISTGYTKLDLVGHTDNVGSKWSAIWLSKKRSDVTRAYIATKLAAAGVAVTGASQADLKPLASNKTSTGRALNRRVEIKIGG